MTVLPERLDEDGTFPFGAPNGPRPVRPAASGDTRLVVIGTYASALHVGWQAPAHVQRPRGTTGRVASLAIDVEPMVFWDGLDAEQHIAQWIDRIGFSFGDGPGCHGHLFSATNGPSGDALRSDYFPALTQRIEDTAFLDAYPVYFAKRGTSARRGQADAIDSEYNAILDQLAGGVYGRSRLPIRPPKSALPFLAAERFGNWILQSIQALASERVVTLGEEAWNTLGYLGVIANHPCVSLAETRTRGYGQSGTLVVAGRELEWTPLAHPGAIRQSKSKPGGWGDVHAHWLAANSSAV